MKQRQLQFTAVRLPPRNQRRRLLRRDATTDGCSMARGSRERLAVGTRRCPAAKSNLLGGLATLDEGKDAMMIVVGIANRTGTRTCNEYDAPSCYAAIEAVA